MGAVQGGPDEAELLACWRAGDAAAGQQLARQSYWIVSRYLRAKVLELRYWESLSDRLRSTMDTLHSWFQRVRRGAGRLAQ
jgi:hypothetical protein